MVAYARWLEGVVCLTGTQREKPWELGTQSIVIFLARKKLCTISNYCIVLTFTEKSWVKETQEQETHPQSDKPLLGSVS